jgi:hypothetical protein
MNKDNSGNGIAKNNPEVLRKMLDCVGSPVFAKDRLHRFVYLNKAAGERRKMEETMKEVDTLRGLIPICAKCKSVHDDKGFWQKVEIYLEKHSSARFTHGLCKDCLKELYGKESWFKKEDE